MLFLGEDTVLIVAAVVPAIVLLGMVYRADRLEREPPILLLSLVLRGVFATVIAVWLERFGLGVLDAYFVEGTLVYNALMYFIVVAVSEEGAKYILLKRRTWRSGAFNCQFDGVVYAVFVSLGFALWENIGYVMLYGLHVALVRAVTAVPGHACFGVFMGVWYGLAKRYENRGKRRQSRRCRRLAVLVPVLLHGAYDFIATLDDLRATLVFFLFIAALFGVSLRLVHRGAENDRYIDNSNFFF